MADSLHKQFNTCYNSASQVAGNLCFALLVRCICLMLELKLTCFLAAPSHSLVLTLSAFHDICTAMPAAQGHQVPFLLGTAQWVCQTCISVFCVTVTMFSWQCWCAGEETLAESRAFLHCHPLRCPQSQKCCLLIPSA